MTPADALLMEDVLQVAPALLGWELRAHGTGGIAGGVIVEVEAYHGTLDPASHAYRGVTPRTKPMFEAGGSVYLYLSYGLHTCLNLVTGPADEAQAVLIRALEPTIGLDLMATRRHTTRPRLLTSGPGRVGQALGLSVEQSGQRLGESIELQPPAAPVSLAQILTGPRVGIRAGGERPWRFWIAGNPFVSGPRQ